MRIDAAPRTGCWPSPVRRRRRVVAVTAFGAVALLTARPARPQTCREPHYRWTQKVDTSLVAVPAESASLGSILATWMPPDLGQRDRCAPRVGQEQRTYTLLGWVRRVDKFKDDGDWHIELTERADSPPDSCIVVEIPARRYSPRYALARAALDSLSVDRRIRRGGFLVRPVRVRVTGAAFFDGQHRRGGRHSDRSDGGHGRCNTSVRALWEIHPVYAVSPP